jgi:hypothetical protein
MMKQRTLVHAAVGAAILSFATAFAAGAQTSRPGQPGIDSGSGAAGSPPPAERSTTPGAMPGDSSATSPGASGIVLKEGMAVVNTEGKTIGEVAGIDGDRVIVSVGGFLGIGERDVALNLSQFQAMGSGDDAKLQTTMTEDELKALPEYKAPAESGGGMRTR